MLEARADVQPTERPRRPLLVAGALTSGPGDVAEFLLPLWAGVQLGASAGVSGGPTTILLVGAVIGRFLGGRFADRGLRLVVALTATSGPCDQPGPASFQCSAIDAGSRESLTEVRR